MRGWQVARANGCICWLANPLGSGRPLDCPFHGAEYRILGGPEFVACPGGHMVRPSGPCGPCRSQAAVREALT